MVPESTHINCSIYKCPELRYDLIDSDHTVFMFKGTTRAFSSTTHTYKNLPQVHSNHIKNDSLLEHSFPAPLVYLLSHTLSML